MPSLVNDSRDAPLNANVTGRPNYPGRGFSYRAEYALVYLLRELYIEKDPSGSAESFRYLPAHGSSTLAIRESGVLASCAPAKEKWSCHKSSSPGDPFTARNPSGGPPLRAPLSMIATRGASA